MKREIMIAQKNRTANFIDNESIEYCSDSSSIIFAYANHYGLSLKLNSRPQYITDIYAKTINGTEYFYKMVDAHAVNMCIKSNAEGVNILVDMKKLYFTTTDLDYIADLIKSTIVVE